MTSRFQLPRTWLHQAGRSIQHHPPMSEQHPKSEWPLLCLELAICRPHQTCLHVLAQDIFGQLQEAVMSRVEHVDRHLHVLLLQMRVDKEAALKGTRTVQGPALMTARTYRVPPAWQVPQAALPRAMSRSTPWTPQTATKRQQFLWKLRSQLQGSLHLPRWPSCLSSFPAGMVPEHTPAAG